MNVNNNSIQLPRMLASSNTCYVDDVVLVYDSDTVKRDLVKSMNSGLIVDEENDLFYREGYGVLIGVAPDNSNIRNIRDVIEWDPDHSSRFVTKVIEVFGGVIVYPLRFYQGYINDFGYDIVIGPGGFAHGKHFDKGIYCTNFYELLKRNKSKQYKNN